jgi:hypothetical protein
MLQLPNTFNLQNPKQLMHKVRKIDIQGNIKLCSFDITNMYTNIPQKELITCYQQCATKQQTHSTKTLNNNPIKYNLKPKLHATQQPPV